MECSLAPRTGEQGLQTIAQTVIPAPGELALDAGDNRMPVGV